MPLFAAFENENVSISKAPFLPSIQKLRYGDIMRSQREVEEMSRTNPCHFDVKRLIGFKQAQSELNIEENSSF